MYYNQINMKPEYVVWWIEVGAFDGKEMRHYRDFANYMPAMRFFKSLPDLVNAHVSKIYDCPWHHSHAYSGHLETL